MNTITVCHVPLVVIRSQAARPPAHYALQDPSVQMSAPRDVELRCARQEPSRMMGRHHALPAQRDHTPDGQLLDTTHPLDSHAYSVRPAAILMLRVQRPVKAAPVDHTQRQDPQSAICAPPIDRGVCLLVFRPYRPVLITVT